MIDYLKRHIQLAVLIVFWIVSGIYLTPLCFAAVPLSVIVFKSRNLYTEMLIGLFVLLVLSDSWQHSMEWAPTMRNLYFFMMAILFFFNLRSFPYANKLYLPFIPFFIVAAVLVYRSPDLNTTIQKTVSFILAYIVFPFYFIKVLHEDRDRFLRGLVYAIALLLIYGFLMIPLFPDAAYLIGRYRGVMGNPNGLGMLCQIFFAFFTIVITNHKGLFSKREIVFVYGLIFVSVILSESRNTIFTILIFYLFYRFFRVSYLMGFVLILLIAIVNQLVIANLGQILAALGLQEYMRAETIQEGSGRLVAWKFALEHIRQNVFFGRGMNYEVWLYTLNKDYLSRLGHIGNSHNSWLALWLNTGLVGLILFLYAFFYRFARLARQTAFALPLMYSVMFSATFEAWMVGSLNVSVPFLILIWSYFEAQRLEPSPGDIPPAPA